MGADAERKLHADRAGHVEDVGRLELAVVAVGRRVHQQHLVAGVQLLAVELVVLGDGAAHVEDR